MTSPSYEGQVVQGDWLLCPGTQGATVLGLWETVATVFLNRACLLFSIPSAEICGYKYSEVLGFNSSLFEEATLISAAQSISWLDLCVHTHPLVGFPTQCPPSDGGTVQTLFQVYTWVMLLSLSGKAIFPEVLKSVFWSLVTSSCSEH